MLFPNYKIRNILKHYIASLKHQYMCKRNTCRFIIIKLVWYRAFFECYSMFGFLNKWWLTDLWDSNYFTIINPRKTARVYHTNWQYFSMFWDVVIGHKFIHYQDFKTSVIFQQDSPSFGKWKNNVYGHHVMHL